MRQGGTLPRVQRFTGTLRLRRIAGAAVLLVLASLPFSARAQQPSFDEVAARAAAARDQNNLPLAVQLYAQAEQMRPDWQEGWWFLGLLHYSANEYAPAIEAFNHLLELAPRAAPAMALRGLCEYETGAYDPALRDLDMAVAHGAANQPQNEQIIRYHLAQLLTRTGRFQDALEQYKVFATQHVQSPDLMLGIGLAGMRLASLNQDVAEKDRALFQQVGAASYALLAGETQTADADFAKLFAAYPEAPHLHLCYGVLLFSHDPGLAVDQFQAEVAIAPDNVEAHALLAFALMITGRYAEAVPEAKRALASDPAMEMAQLSLGRSLAETGDTTQATELLNKVLLNDPDNLEAHMGLASIYARTGREEDAYRERMVCLKLAK